MIHYYISKSLAAGGFLHPLRRNAMQCCARKAGSTASPGFPDYFCILGVGRTFIQSPDELKAKYKSLMSRVHPDRHTTACEEVKSLNASIAADVTRAYNVLEDPLARALHLLELHGQGIGESDSVRMLCYVNRVNHRYFSPKHPIVRTIFTIVSITVPTQSIANNAFLMEIMEAREEVESASSDDELRPLLRSCQTRQSELCRDLEKSFGDDRVDDAKLQTAKLQYWKRIEETIMEKISSVE